MKKTVITLISTLFAVAAFAASAPSRIDLSGRWDFAMGADAPYAQSISLPGSMLTNGLGNNVDTRTQWTGSLYDMSYYHRADMAPYRVPGNIKFPFFLTPAKEYVGIARYRREVTVPSDWKGRRVTLTMERPHIETTLYINGREVGHQMSLSTPHVYDVTEFVTPGTANTVEVKVYNGIENVCVGQDSHSVTDQTQGNWNGITGEISLTAAPKGAGIGLVRVYPDMKLGVATVKAVITGDKRPSKIKAYARLQGDAKAAEIRAPRPEWHGDTAVFTLPMAKHGFKAWSEFTPAVYDLTVEADKDVKHTVFGMRSFTADGMDLKINDIPVILRGTVENCCFPLTGYAPTDVEEWERIFRVCKDYGLNMMRFHSYCPPEAAFTAADRVGIYLQPEGPSWPNHGVRLERGMAIDKYLLDEGKRIVDTYGNHPSFVMMAAGNEPAGDWVKYCRKWVAAMKAYDPSRLYCGASVGGGWAWDEGSEYHVKGGARGLDWDKHLPAATDDYRADILNPRNFKPTATRPVNTEPYVSHEKGQWCAYPDYGEIDQYTGPYKAANFEIFRDLMNANGMKGMGEKFLMASGRLQQLCYKYEMERNLRTPGYAGFQLLGLNDYSGQGTALVGVLNVFWREKPYTDRHAWRQACSPVVVLGRLPRFVYTDADTLAVPFEAVNYGGSDLGSRSLRYTLATADSTLTLASGTLPAAQLPIGKNLPLGAISLPLSQLPATALPAKLRLSAEIPGVAENSWEVWVYPSALPEPVVGNVHVTDTLDSKALDVLGKGGKVLITAAGKVTLGSDVKQTYLPVFWNTSWFKMRPPHTTGATIDTAHPLFAHGFPTDDWSNLNWWELLNGSQVMNLLELPVEYQSPIQPIDTWHQSRKLGMMVEARVGGGSLLITTMPVTAPRGPVARQMRHALLSYMNSADFAPTLTLAPETVTAFFTKQTPPVITYTTASPDELKPAIVR